MILFASKKNSNSFCCSFPMSLWLCFVICLLEILLRNFTDDVSSCLLTIIKPRNIIGPPVFIEHVIFVWLTVFMSTNLIILTRERKIIKSFVWQNYNLQCFTKKDSSTRIFLLSFWNHEHKLCVRIFKVFSPFLSIHVHIFFTYSFVHDQFFLIHSFYVHAFLYNF